MTLPISILDDDRVVAKFALPTDAALFVFHCEYAQQVRVRRREVWSRKHSLTKDVNEVAAVIRRALDERPARTVGGGR